ncbi:MAG TPA: SNF2-related protein, partial [Gemmatimonadales bacterium]
MQPPNWLLPEQVTSFRRALAALSKYRGALLADPVGSGKTFVALAVARELNRGPTACLVPATLLAQWQATAARLGAPVSLCSHEQVSRGKLPQNTRGLVLIDESHHFRNPATRRYRHLAPWLVKRATLLITATPIVNRMSDLAHQLLLSVRDDALLPDGIPSLKQLLTSCQPADALGQLVLENDGLDSRRPRSRYWCSFPSRQETAVLARRSESLSRLRLSRSQAVSALIRGVLFRALASSPAALEGALRRYRRLLLHARDAKEAGRELDRAELRGFTRSLGDQLIWWELLPPAESKSEIEISDLEELPDQITRARAAME